MQGRREAYLAAIPLVFMGAEAMAALGAYEGLTGMLGAAVRHTSRALPHHAAGSAGPVAADITR